ncbi:MAG: amino acid ABC transporter substrate-binding protein [Clostridia bacterium]|nr:amino acid ABC transporter substrate-binding protein [Clostridia bacterium]
MKNLKKIIALVMALCMLLCFAGCGAEDTTSESKPTTTEKATLTTVKEGKLIMATNAYFQPYEYYDGDKIVGIDAEIAAAIAEKLGLELVIEDMAFDSIITAVTEGKVDLGLAGMTITEERLKSVNFSISYAKGVQSIIVKEGSPITSVDDLYADGAAYKVGTQLGTTGYIYATDDFGEGLVTPYTTGNEAVAALIGGDVDCVIIDNEPAKSFVANNTGLKILETSYADEDYAACIAKNNEALLEAIDTAITELTADGTIQAIVDKYIK